MASSVEHKPAAYQVSVGEELAENENSAPHDGLVEESRTQNMKGPSSLQRRRRRHVLQLWINEMASLVAAGGFLATIWAVIAHYDGEPIPSWPLAINLSTLVSLLSVGFRLAAIAPVAAVMSQQKWSWLGGRKPRPLLDLQRIDAASVSVTASAQLLLRGPRSPVVMLGAATLLLALGVGPVSQQAIRTVPCDQVVGGATASIAVANLMTGEYRRYGAGLWDLSATGKGALLNGLVNPQGNDSAMPVTCSTGNCTFAEHGGVTYSSIGLCHACIDTSALITNTTAEANKSSDVLFSMPNGLQLNSQLNLASGPFGNNFSVESKLFTPEFAAVASDSIANVTILTLTNAPCSDSPGYAACNNSSSTFLSSLQRALAVSCALHPCIQRFHGAVTNGHLDEVVVSTSSASKSMSLPNDRNSMMNYTALEIPCLIDNQPYDLSNFSRLDRTRHNFTDVVINGTTVPAPFECVYILEATYARALAAYLNGANYPDFTGNLLAGTCVNNVDTRGLNCGNGKFWLENFWGSGGTDGGAPTLTTVSEVVARFATVVSGHFRRAGSTLYTRPRSLDDPFPGIPRPALGTVHTTTVAVPGDGGAAGCYSLGGRYAYRDRPVWKASPLPLLLHMVDEPVPVAGLTDEKRLAEWAGRKKVQFVRQGELGVVRLT
ncbi:hypothetical protein B0H67DRAFT_557146 [Lasiosphaeris hirsuta]|uniref:Uncharacterized protein n=1 Tax=Lasiosphaeris hirsuta TaxID=260670 RepID=A0AA39ZV97_9PEZI|nr:hypothetical protein B0H67DRAFT_557146 [Lasiosphaeris hirsuta]